MSLVLPLAHIPIPSSLNPVVVIRAVGVGVDSYVDVVPREGLDVVDLPKGVGYYVTEFKRKLEELLNRRFRLVCRGSSTFKPLLYVVVTNSILRGLYGELDEGIVNIAARVDLDLGLPSYVPALRFAELTSSHYVWRYSEAFVELNGGVTFKIIRTASYGTLGTPFILGREALVHLLGRLSLELSKAISQGDLNSIRRLIEFANGLWHSIYGLKTPCGGGVSTYVPNIDEVLCIEIEVESLKRYPWT
jgi:hypothetical protein